jgi:hypothetical protein
LYTLKPLARTPDIAPDSVRILGLCASEIADVAAMTTTNRALIMNWESNLGILTFWLSDRRDHVTTGRLSKLADQEAKRSVVYPQDRDA